ncbi:MAG: hypothetical protein OES69_10005 [Myxococcales bacterium]|nr:hypothetical protein [Myxococcales bacterium]MDH3844261.1 hypothetical protein [Myxococcales bacterium]
MGLIVQQKALQARRSLELIRKRPILPPHHPEERSNLPHDPAGPDVNVL